MHWAADNSEARLKDNADWLILDMGQVIPKHYSGSILKVYELDGGSDGNIRVSTSASGPWTDVLLNANPGNPGTWTVNEDWRYIELTRTNGNFDIDAVEAIYNEDSIVCFNPAPLALDDDTTIVFNTAVTLNVLANDADPYEDTLQVTTILNAPANGTAVINPDYTITYTPNTGFTGTEIFQYIVCDTVSPPACDTAQVTITIPNGLPTALDDTASTEANTPVDVPVLANDTDPEGGNLIITYHFSSTCKWW